MLYMTYLASGGTVVVDCICPSVSSMADQANSAYSSAASLAGEDVATAQSTCGEGCFMYKTFDYTDNR